MVKVAGIKENGNYVALNMGTFFLDHPKVATFHGMDLWSMGKGTLG